jgi:type VI secretion system protein ImpH
MAVNFFGLSGALGVLPTRYSELILERLHARDATLRDFLDIFNHRLISLLYRAWEKYRFPIAYERSGEDPVSGYLLALIGLGMPALRGRQVISDQALIGYEGLLAQFPRSATAFRQILTDYFGVLAEVEPFAGCWRPLDSGSQTMLEGGFSRSEQLGAGVVMGDEVWDQQSLVRLRLGPMPLATYNSFLPGGDAHEPLRAWARFFCGEDVDVEVQLVLQREEAPRCSLDSPENPEPGFSVNGAASQAPRLGWVSWLFTRPLDRDPDETVMRLWE